jgi:hypothetical protein
MLPINAKISPNQPSTRPTPAMIAISAKKPAVTLSGRAIC